MQPLFRRSIRYLLAVMVPAMIAVPVNAQAPAKEAATAKAAVDAPSDPRDTIISEVSFDEVPLEDVVSYLQDASKTYRAVVIRKTGKDKGPLVTMRVKNVSVEQVLQIIQTASPHVHIEPVDGAGGVVDVIIVDPVGHAAAGAEGMAVAGEMGVGMPGGIGGPGMMAGGGFGPGGHPQDASTVRVYRLSGIIMDMKNKQGWAGEAAGEAKAQEAATANVLSLVKATMEMLGGSEPPKLQLHPETQALIFSGSARQQTALEDVLAALESDRVIRSPKGDAAAAEADTRRLQNQLDESQGALQQARQENVLLKTELSAVQRQMELQMQELVARNRQVTAEMEAVRAQLRDLESKTGKPR